MNVPILLLDPDSPCKRRVLDLGEMLEAKCIGRKRFVITMPDRRWCFKVATDADAAMWVACILEATCESILPLSSCVAPNYWLSFILLSVDSPLLVMG